MRKVNVRVNLQHENTAMFFIIEETKETILNFSEGTAKVLPSLFCFNIISICND